MVLKGALSEAVRYVSEAESLTGGGESPDSFRKEGCVAIEEVRFDEMEHAWQVSVGFFRPWNRSESLGSLIHGVQMSDLRTVKTVVLDDASGVVVDYRSYEGRV